MIKAFIFILNFCTFCLSSHVDIFIEQPESLDFANEDNLERLEAFLDGLKAHINKDDEMAFNNFKKAATIKGGNAEAMYLLSLYYLSGRGTSRDIDMALAYLDASAKKGFVAAAAWLVWLNLEGAIVPIDEIKAKQYSSLLVGKENESKFCLGTAICTYTTDPKKIVMGLWLIISAAHAGYNPAQELAKKDGIENVLSKMVIESNLHDDLRYFNGIDEHTIDYELAKKSF